MRTERLISNSGHELPWGIIVHLDSYEDAMALGGTELTRLTYEHKLLVIKGMKGVTKPQFWDLCNTFGQGCWTKQDYIVGREQTFPHRRGYYQSACICLVH